MRVVEIAVPEEGALWVDRKDRACELGEPRSVLDHLRSPSPPTSTSTLSYEIVGVVARQWPQVSGENDGNAAELRPLPGGLGFVGSGAEDFATAATAAIFSAPATSPEQDQTFRWIMGDVEDPPTVLNSSDFGLAVDPTFVFDHSDLAAGVEPSLSSETGFSFFSAGEPNSSPAAPPPPPPISVVRVPSFGNPDFAPNFPPNSELFLPNFLQSLPAQNPPFFFSPSTFTAVHHHHSSVRPTFSESGGTGGGPDLFIRRNYPPLDNSPPQRPIKSRPSSGEEGVIDQLFKAAEMVEAGNSGGATAILARLNHQLPSPSGKPLLRSAFYFKESLHCLLSPSSSSSSLQPPATPIDVILKLSAYKSFSDISPVLQFTNFTSVQVLLEELGAVSRIHIIDFDIGIGGQWSSFMQELAHRRPAAAAPFLKITASVDPKAHHPLELHLIRENLTQFASDLDIPFQFNALNLDTLDPYTILATTQSGEAIAINLSLNSPTFNPSTLRRIKKLSPKVVVAVDHGDGGGDRSNLSFSHLFMQAFQSSVVLLESIEAAGVAMDVYEKIERFLLHPRIENAILQHRRRGAEPPPPPWRSVFASSSFTPLQFSNFTEIQAECLLKRVQIHGFRIDKKQETLSLYWQRGELASVSAWRCS